VAERITLAELITAGLDARLVDLHVAMPARVESYDASKQTADVLPQLDRAVPDGAGGYTIEQLPVIPNVRVAHPRGGGFFASFPLQKGDFVLLVFCERDLNAWRHKGERTDPGDLRMHPLSGAVAIPCNLYPSGQELDGASGDNMVIGKDGGALIQVAPNGGIAIDSASAQNVTFNGGSQGVARVGDSTNGHVHTLSGTAGPYPIVGTALTATDTIAENGVKVKA
jgi:hypothetical protein